MKPNRFFRFVTGRLAAAASFAVAGANSATAQSAAATTSTPCGADLQPIAESDRLPAFMVRQLSANDVRLLRSSLRNGCWSRALATYYSVFRPDLPDWIVYIDSSGSIHQTFIHGRGGDSTSRMLHGERYIWAAVFSDRPMRDELSPEEDRALRADDAGTPIPRSPPVDRALARVCTAAPVAANASLPAASGPTGGASPGGGARGAALSSDTSDLRFSRRLIAYHRDPVVSLLIKGLTKLVGVDPGTDPSMADSTRIVELQQVSADSTGERMYAGFGRFGLIDNAQVELSLAPVRCKEFPAPRRPAGDPEPDSSGRIEFIYGDFVNAKQHAFELGVLTGVTWGTRIPTYGTNLQVTSETPRLGANAYLTVVYNMTNLGFLSGRLAGDPFWQRRPLGLFAGTNVARGSLCDELVAGGVIGNLLGNAGAAVGCSWANAPSVENGHTVGHMVGRLLVGFDLRL